MTKENNPIGRPTVYKEEYCDEILKLRQKGMCEYQVADYWDVSVRTIHNWRAKYPHFLQAYIRAEEAHKAWFLQRVADGFFDNKDKRLNQHAIKLYAYWLFGITEKSTDSTIELPKEFYQPETTIKRKHQILNEEVANKKITVSQYQAMQIGLVAEADNTDKREAKDLLESLQSKKDK